MKGPLDIEIAGEALQLWPERALSWARTQTVLIADPHFGKAAAFRSVGIATPDSIDDDLDRLNRVFMATGATRLVVLGDFLHARSGRTESTLGALERWRTRLPDLQVIMVRGNHDLAAGDPPETLNISCHPEPLWMSPFVLRHVPSTDLRGHVLAGHIHPGISLRDRNGTGLRMPCLITSAPLTLMPAFGTFTGLKMVRRSRNDRVFAIGPDAVMEIP